MTQPEKCELCHGTKFYGDRGPGRKGNSEYVRCEICNPDTPQEGAETREALALRLANEKWWDYEKNFILPLFPEATRRGFDLQKLVLENAGKNSLQCFLEFVVPLPNAPSKDEKAQPTGNSAIGPHMDDADLSKWIAYLERPDVVLSASSKTEWLSMAVELQDLRTGLTDGLWLAKRIRDLMTSEGWQGWKLVRHEDIEIRYVGEETQLWEASICPDCEKGIRDYDGGSVVHPAPATPTGIAPVPDGIKKDLTSKPPTGIPNRWSSDFGMDQAAIDSALAAMDLETKAEPQPVQEGREPREAEESFHCLKVLALRCGSGTTGWSKAEQSP